MPKQSYLELFLNKEVVFKDTVIADNVPSIVKTLPRTTQKIGKYYKFAGDVKWNHAIEVIRYTEKLEPGSYVLIIRHQDGSIDTFGNPINILINEN